MLNPVFQDPKGVLVRKSKCPYFAHKKLCCLAHVFLLCDIRPHDRVPLKDMKADWNSCLDNKIGFKVAFRL